MNEAEILKTAIQAGIPAALLLLLVWRGVPALAAFAASMSESQKALQVTLADLGATMRAQRDEIVSGLSRVEAEIRDAGCRGGPLDRRSLHGGE